MFVKNSEVIIADDDEVNSVEYPIQLISRKDSIMSYNFSRKVLFYSHINKVITEAKTAEFKLVQLMAVNPRGKVFTVICDDATKIGTARGRYVDYTEISKLRSNSSMLIDTDGLLCKIISIAPHSIREIKLYDVRSNKGHSKFVNGLLFKA